jgi:hypothetical protein
VFRANFWDTLRSVSEAAVSPRSTNTDLPWRDDAERSEQFRSAFATHLGY